jgi:5-oxoprolinase (ATP-hydrolysing) subunit A
MNATIDLNCDMGESYGAWTMGNDAAVLKFVSSANIACGFYGGDPGVMRQTLAAALQQGVALGAHPSLPDLAGFGRRVMQISPQDAYDMVVYQIGALSAVTASQGASLHHVKAHGALYNMAAKDVELAKAICRAVHDVDANLIVYELAGSQLIHAAHDTGLAAANEVFADRSYQDDGSLTPRSHPNAMIEDLDRAVAQVLDMVLKGHVRSVSGKSIPVQADTLCIHGDQPNALHFAHGIHDALLKAGVAVRSVNPSSHPGIRTSASAN